MGSGSTSAPLLDRLSIMGLDEPDVRRAPADLVTSVSRYNPELKLFDLFLIIP